MPWRPLPKIAFAIATYPFEPSSPEDLPLELGDELYIIEEGGQDWSWFRGYLVAPPSILAGLTSVKGRTLEARVFSGVFPKACVAVKEYLDNNNTKDVDEVASTVRSVRSGTPHGNDEDTTEGEAEEDDDDESLGPDDSASQMSISQDSRNGHTRIRKRSKEDALDGAPVTEESQDRKDNPNGQSSVQSKAVDTPRAKPPAPVPMLKIGDDNSGTQSEPLIDEIASCLREWYSTNLHELTLSRRYAEIEKLTKLQKKLDHARRQMQAGNLTTQELTVVREKTVWSLVKGNKMLSNEVIVRDPTQGGRLLTGNDNALHVASLQAQMSLLKKPILPLTEEINHHHILFELKDAHSLTKDKITLFVAIYTKEGSEDLKPLSEPYSIELASGSLVKSQASNQLRTLFGDLAASDVGETKPFGTSVYLVIKAQAQLDLPRPRSRQNSFNESLKDSTPSENGNPALKSRRSLMFGSKGFNTQRSKAKVPTQASLAEESNSAPITPETIALTLSGHNVDNPLNNSQPKHYNKDVGFAVVELKNLSEISAGIDKSVDLWYPTETSTEAVEYKDMHLERLNELFHSSTGSFTRSRHISHLKLRLQSFLHRDAEDLIRATPTLLHDTVCSRKIGFSGVPDKPRSDIYLTILNAHLPSAAMFSHPTRAAIPIEGLQNSTPLVVNVDVKTADGQSVTECIRDASNAQSVTTWQSSAVTRGSRWSQTLKLSVPKDQVSDCHVVMTVGDPTDTPIGICYIPLWIGGAFVSDGPHSLLFYPNDRVIGRSMAGKPAYLHLGWNRTAKDNRQSWSHDMAVLRVRTDLVSTFFSQNQVLLSVLNWKDQSDEDLIRALQQLRNVPDLELVKFVSDVLDALFGILVQRNGNDEFEDLIFRSVVDILTIAQSKRFNLTPVIDDYTNSRFNFPFAAPCLMRSYLRLIMLRSDDGNSRQLRATLKVGRQILKFILYARKQQIRKEEYIGINNEHDQSFTRDIRKLFSALEDQMRDSTPSSIGNKTLLVQHLHTWLPDLLKSFGEEETAGLATSFIEACSHVTGKLILHKLVSIWNLVKLSRGWKIEVRKNIETETISWLSQYWGIATVQDEQYREQVRLCVSIISLLDGDYGPRGFDILRKTLQSFRCIASMSPEKSGTFSLLFPSTYPFPSRPTASERNYDECLIELAALKANFKIEDVPSQQSKISDNLDTINDALEIDIMILQGRAFPKSWITLHAYYHRAVMSWLQFFTDSAQSANLCPPPEDSDSFNMELWKAFLDTLLAVVRSDALALEALPEQRRKAVWKILGDLRETGARLLSQNWHALGWPADAEDQAKYRLSRLGGYQVQYVPSLVSPIVELCLSVHEGLRTAAVEILRSMIIAEYDLNGDISAIQIEMVQTLNDLFKTKTIADSALQRLFINQLMDGFQNLRDAKDDGIWNVCHELVQTIDELLDLLVAAHTSDQHELLQMINTLALLDFLRSMEKDDIYIEYAHQLADAQAMDRNYQEAGLALKLHADLYKWDLETKTEALKNPHMPIQTAFDRKEELYMKMIDYFEKGAIWGSAMDCYLELAHQYQHTTFNFSKLAKAQHSMARIHESIAKGNGESSRYFHVEFTGLGFPPTLRNKSFIYEGFGAERLTSFIDRLQKQHPMAKLLDANDNADVEEAEGQYIKIAIVQVHINLSQPILRRSKVPLSTKEYVLSHKPKFFSMTVEKYRGTEKGDQEVDKLVFETSETFPTILRRVPIVSEKVTHLSALQTAIERVLRKTYELRHLVKRVSEDAPGSLKTLADAIKSQVDPISDTSVTVYRPLLRKHQISTPRSDQSSVELSSALEIALLDFATLLRDNIPLLQDGRQMEYKNSSILFKSTFEPELSIIASMAPPTVNNQDQAMVETETGVYALENTLSMQSLSNGHADTGYFATSSLSQTPMDSRRRQDTVPHHLADATSLRSLQTTSVNGEAPGPSIPTSRYQSSVDVNGPRSVSRASTQHAEKTMAYNVSTSNAANRQSWRTESEATTGISNDGSTPKGSTARLAEKTFSVAAVKVRNTSHDRPQTGHSAAQSSTPSLRSTTGSIRKRLSAFGMSKKANKVLGIHEGLKEEEI